MWHVSCVIGIQVIQPRSISCLTTSTWVTIPRWTTWERLCAQIIFGHLLRLGGARMRYINLVFRQMEITNITWYTLYCTASWWYLCLMYIVYTCYSVANKVWIWPIYFCAISMASSCIITLLQAAFILRLSWIYHCETSMICVWVQFVLHQSPCL